MKILIVEDEPVHARYLKKILEEMIPADMIQEILMEESISSAELILKEGKIDLIFLDLNVYGENGFDLLKNVPTTNILTIVVSANIDLALTAFEYGVIDFIPKPVQEERLKLGLERYFSFRELYKIENLTSTSNEGDKSSKEVTRQYTKTRLLTVNLEDLQNRLDHLMNQEKIYTDEDLSLEILATMLNLHPRQLSEFLNGRMKITFNSYIHKYRIEDAKKFLLAFPEKNISDIGFEVGYKSLSSFYDAFKKETGMTASEFRSHEISKKE